MKPNWHCDKIVDFLKDETRLSSSTTTKTSATDILSITALAHDIQGYKKLKEAFDEEDMLLGVIVSNIGKYVYTEAHNLLIAQPPHPPEKNDIPDWEEWRDMENSRLDAFGDAYGYIRRQECLVYTIPPETCVATEKLKRTVLELKAERAHGLLQSLLKQAIDNFEKNDRVRKDIKYAQGKLDALLGLVVGGRDSGREGKGSQHSKEKEICDEFLTKHRDNNGILIIYGILQRQHAKATAPKDHQSSDLTPNSLPHPYEVALWNKDCCCKDLIKFLQGSEPSSGIDPCHRQPILSPFALAAVKLKGFPLKRPIFSVLTVDDEIRYKDERATIALRRAAEAMEEHKAYAAMQNIDAVMKTAVEFVEWMREYHSSMVGAIQREIDKSNEYLEEHNKLAEAQEAPRHSIQCNQAAVDLASVTKRCEDLRSSSKLSSISGELPRSVYKKVNLLILHERWHLFFSFFSLRSTTEQYRLTRSLSANPQEGMQLSSGALKESEQLVKAESKHIQSQGMHRPSPSREEEEATSRRRMPGEKGSEVEVRGESLHTQTVAVPPS